MTTQQYYDKYILGIDATGRPKCPYCSKEISFGKISSPYPGKTCGSKECNSKRCSKLAKLGKVGFKHLHDNPGEYKDYNKYIHSDANVGHLMKPKYTLEDFKDQCMKSYKVALSQLPDECVLYINSYLDYFKLGVTRGDAGTRAQGLKEKSVNQYPMSTRVIRGSKIDLCRIEYEFKVSHYNHLYRLGGYGWTELFRLDCIEELYTSINDPTTTEDSRVHLSGGNGETDLVSKM